MRVQTLTIGLPESVYRRVQMQSQYSQRTVAEEVVAVVINALPEDERIAPDIERDLATLEFFTDDELWQTAQAQVSQETSDQLQFLLDKQQREGLTQSEKTTAQSLAQYHDRVMLLRAKAAVLLKRRGFDITTLLQTASQ